MAGRDGIAQALEEFRAAGPPLVLVLGAGISRAAPPLALELIDGVLALIESAAGMSTGVLDRLRRGIKHVNLPLEYFAQVIYGTLGSELLHLLVRCFPANCSFNGFHWAIARAALRGRVACIVTLNWDELIERALEAAGVCCSDGSSPQSPNGRFYRVLCGDELPETDLGALRRTTTPGDTVLVVKPHGTISRPATLRTTVESYQSWFTSPRDMSIVEFLRSERHTVFVAGYSGRDELFRRLFGGRGVGFRPERKLSETVYWLDRPGAVLADHVRDFLETDGVVPIAIAAEEFAVELLKGDIESPALSGAPTASAVSTEETHARPMKLYNALARLAAQLGQHADTCALIRAGFTETGDDERQGSEHVQGLAVIGAAKAALDDLDGAAADLDQAIADWDDFRDTVPDWMYRHAEMRLARGRISHLRNRHITDQIFAYDEMLAANKAFLDWHDKNMASRNFESSPEYATLQYNYGMFMVRGGDAAKAGRHFARLLDVDVFNDLHMAAARQKHGNALCAQAHGDTKGAISFAAEALRLIPESCEYWVQPDVLALLASLHEARGNRSDAANAFDELSRRLETWVGDEARARLAKARADSVRPFFHSRKSASV